MKQKLPSTCSIGIVSGRGIIGTREEEKSIATENSDDEEVNSMNKCRKEKDSFSLRLNSSSPGYSIEIETDHDFTYTIRAGTFILFPEHPGVKTKFFHYKLSVR